MPNALNAILFDHDGTLVDSEPVHYHCWQEILAPWGASFSLEHYNQQLNGMPSLQSARWIVNFCQLPISPAELYSLKQARVDAYLVQQPFPLMPGAYELVAFCADKGLKLAVASGAGRHEIQRSLHAHGLDRFIRHIASKDDVVNNKPAPDVYRLAMEKLAETPAHCWAVEDSTSGQQAALAAGVTCLRLGTAAPVAGLVLCQDLQHVQETIAQHCSG
jgi:HAD superfamily hydrolase (TIGR01509 family)